jgi:hypothetical protein
MIRRLIAVGTIAGLSLVASTSSAADTGSFGQQGQFIFSADRLFDLFAYGNIKTHPDAMPNNVLTNQGTSFGLFGGTSQAFASAIGATTGVGGAYGTVYNIPRFGFDYTIINNLTIGGDLLLYFALGGSTHTDPSTMSTDLPSGNLIGLFPHVGYIFGVNDLLSFWLRGGLHYWNAQVNGKCGGNNTVNTHAFGVDIDPSIVISPVRHFAFFAGPALDAGFLGGASGTSFGMPPACPQTQLPNANLSMLNFSLSAGLLGWL